MEQAGEAGPVRWLWELGCTGQNKKGKGKEKDFLFMK
jgi:hypothetical protein